MISRKSQLAAFILALIVVFSLSNAENGQKRERAAVGKISPVERRLDSGVLPIPELEAKAVYVFDIKKNKALYTKNENIQLPLASLAKIMTALVAMRNIPGDSVITISDEAIKEEGDSNFTAGERWPLKNILGLTLISSSNDGAAAVAEAFEPVGNDGRAMPESFVNKMNETARELGLKQTYFLNETGLDFDSAISGAYGSAKDVLRLMIEFSNKNPEISEITSYDNAVVDSFENEHRVKNTNRLIKDIPGLVFSKTGYTDLAGGNLAIIFEVGPERPVAAVVLGSSEEGRFDDMKKIVNASIRYVGGEEGR